MLSSLTTKIALRKVGIKSDTFSFPAWTGPGLPESPQNGPRPPPSGRKSTNAGLDETERSGAAWPAWMRVSNLPISVQPWLSPPPPPVPVAVCPHKGDMAPVDRDGKVAVAAGRPVIVVFLRCVGCACELASLP